MTIAKMAPLSPQSTREEGTLVSALAHSQKLPPSTSFPTSSSSSSQPPSAANTDHEHEHRRAPPTSSEHEQLRPTSTTIDHDHDRRATTSDSDHLHRSPTPTSDTERARTMTGDDERSRHRRPGPPRHPHHLISLHFPLPDEHCFHTHKGYRTSRSLVTSPAGCGGQARCLARKGSTTRTQPASAHDCSSTVVAAAPTSTIRLELMSH